jgi:putative sigma-54 modulation protein
MIFFIQAAINASAREALQRESERRLHFATDRFEPQIRDVDVVLRDINGPHGGIDKECRVTAKLRRGGSLEVQERADTFIGAIGAAIKRLRYSLGRRLGGKAVHSAIRYDRRRHWGLS